VKDFSFLGYETEKKSDGSSLLKLNLFFRSYRTEIKLALVYEAAAGMPYLRKKILISDQGEGLHFLEKIQIENMKFPDTAITRGDFGQPVFYNDLFLGVEYPAAENTIDCKNVKCGYLAALKLSKKTYESFSSVLGAASSEKDLKRAFMNYVESIKVNGTRAFLLYNSWYDLRNPRIVKEDEHILNEENLLSAIASFKNNLYGKYNTALNAFVLDDGWDKYESLWEIDLKRLPEEFYPLNSALSETGTSLGLWVSPFGGYSNRNIRVKWAKENGYEVSGDFLCFAGTRYRNHFISKMKEYTRQYKIGYFKWDGFPLSCPESDHGHLPGLYSGSDLIFTYIEAMNAVREINPEIFINITIGSWLSPWWLKYADCLWMQGEDYAYAEEVPSLNPRDKAITYRDAVLWKNYREMDLLFPMSSLMTHGIIKGQLNLLGGRDESIESFSNEVIMYFCRGVMMWELYVTPQILSEDEWRAIASAYKWTMKNKKTFSLTDMILGNPLKREPYGYLHLSSEKGIIILRNPYILPGEVEIQLSVGTGQLGLGMEYLVKVVYPYQMILPDKVTRESKLVLNLEGYEVMVLELIQEDSTDKEIPTGKRIEIDGINKQLKIYTESSSDISSEITKPLKLIKQNEFSGGLTLSVPEKYSAAKIGILIEPEKKIPLEDMDAEIKLNGRSVEISSESENGRWYWLTADLNAGTNAIEYLINIPGSDTAKISLWAFADKTLEVEIKPLEGKNIFFGSPERPYPADIKKIKKFLSEYFIESL